MMDKSLIDKDAIERIRQMLLASVLEERNDERFVKKKAVRQLFVPILAARNSGKSFEEISKVLSAGGLTVTIETLRSYFFDLKREQELAASSREHAERVEKARREMAKKVLDQHQRHAEQVARDHVEHKTRTPRFVNAFADGPEAAAAAPLQGAAAVGQGRPKKPPAIAGGEQGGKAAPGGGKAQRRVGEPTLNSETRPPEAAVQLAPLQVAAPAETVQREQEGVSGALVIPVLGHAMTLEAVEAASQGPEERTQLTDGVILRNGKVYWDTGEPFSGFLSKKQIMLLRQVGKIVASVKGNSSKDFVQMPSKL